MYDDYSVSFLIVCSIIQKNVFNNKAKDEFFFNAHMNWNINILNLCIYFFICLKNIHLVDKMHYIVKQKCTNVFIQFIIVFNHIHIVVHLKIILTQMCIGQVLKSTTLQYFNNFLLIFYKLITIKMFCSLIESGYIKTYSNLYIFISKIKVDCFC